MSSTPLRPLSGDPVEHFGALWRGPVLPDLDVFLRGAAELSRDQLAALVRLDQAERCRRGEWLPIEDYLRRYPRLGDDPENTLLLIYGEYLLREQQGQSPSLEEYAARFPALADTFRVQIELHRALESSGMSPTPTQAFRASDPATQFNGAANAASPWPQLPDFEVLGELGRGGMGIVYQARQRSLKRLVALKMIRAGAGAGPELLARFQREAEVAARLQHPNIVQVYEVGNDNSLPYLALEYVAGGSLARWLQGRPQPPRAAAVLAHTLAGATQFAHARGVIHRDLKPANILLQRTEDRGQVPGGSEGPSGSSVLCPLSSLLSPKIADFGLARQLEDDTAQTQTGLILGTPSYMAPEQASGRTQDTGPACDVYALGAILYECLTGRPPFQGPTPLEVLEQVRGVEPVPPRRLQPHVPRDLETICLKCLEKEPCRRYDSAQALGDDLGRFLDGLPTRARPTGLVGRTWKWTRRRPAIAALSAALVALLAGLFVLLAWELRQSEERRAAAAAEALLQTQLRADADQQRDRFERLAAGSLAEFGAARLEQGQTADGLLLLARALEVSHADDQRRSLRRLLAGWLTEVHCARLVLPQDEEVLAQAFALDGKLVTGTPTGIDSWDAATGRLLKRTVRFPHPVGVLALSPDGRTALAGSPNAHVPAQLWNTLTGEPIGAPLEHPDAALIAGFRADGRVAWTADGWVDRGEVHLWDAATGQALGVPFRMPSRVSAASLSPDGKLLLTAGAELLGEGDPKNIKPRLWDVATGGLLREGTREGRFHDDLIAFSPDGRTYATVMDQQARRWDLATHRPLGAPWQVGRARFLAFNPRGDELLTGEGVVFQVWDLEGRPRGLPLRHHDLVATASFSADGSQLFTASHDHTARVWDLAAPRTIGPPLATQSPATHLAFRPDGQTLVTAGADNRVQVWALARDGVRLDVRPFGEPLRPPGAVWAFRSDGLAAVLDGPTGALRLYDLTNGALVGVPLDHLVKPAGTFSLGGREVPVPALVDAVAVVAFSPDGQTVVTGAGTGNPMFGDARGAARLFDAATGKLRVPPLTHHDRVTAVAFSPDGTLLATGSLDGAAHLWDVTTGKEACKPLRHDGAVTALAFSPDGRTLLSAGRDHTARLWDVPTGRPRGAPLAHEDEVLAVAFSPDGRLALTGGKEKAARLWEVATARPVSAPLPHSAAVHLVAFSRDGLLAMTACADETVRLWDVPSARAIGPPLHHPYSVLAAAFSPDSSLVLIGCGAGQAGEARLWPVPRSPADEPARLRRRLEISVGKWLDEGGATHVLDLAGLLERWRELSAP